MAARVRRRSARQAQMEAQKLYAKNGSAGKTSIPVHRVRAAHLVDLSTPQSRPFKDRYPVTSAIDHSHQIKSACRARTGSAPLCNPEVFRPARTPELRALRQMWQNRGDDWNLLR